MRQYSPVRFNEVTVEGAFWRERLDTVLERTIPSQYHQLQIHDMLASLDVVQPPPPLTIPLNRHSFTTQIFWDSDIGKWVEAASYALFPRPQCRNRGSDRRDRRTAGQGPASRRVLQLLVHRPRGRQALDQPARQSRALLRRAHAGRRHRLFHGDRQTPPARRHGEVCRPHRHRVRSRPGPEARLSPATRSWSWRSSASIT